MSALRRSAAFSWVNDFIHNLQCTLNCCCYYKVPLALRSCYLITLDKVDQEGTGCSLRTVTKRYPKQFIKGMKDVNRYTWPIKLYSVKCKLLIWSFDVCLCVCVCVYVWERERESPLLEACTCSFRMTAFWLSFPHAGAPGIFFIQFLPMHCGFMHPFRNSKVVVWTNGRCGNTFNNTTRII